MLAIGSAADQINKMDIVLLADEELRKDSQVIEAVSRRVVGFEVAAGVHR